MKFFDPPNEPAKRKQRTKTSTVALYREDVPYELFTDEELYAAKGGVLVFDVECYVNYWMVGFRCFNTDKIVYFERTETQSLDIPKLLWVLHSFTVVGFNNHSYDNAIIWLAMQGVDNATLKNVSDFIIRENWRLRDVEAAYKFKAGSINSLDLIEVAPLSASLKAYAARLHAPRLQELPFSPETALSPSECVTVRNYNFTDLEDTLLLLRELSPQLELRAALSQQYRQDLRSKSDAQIAEAVICAGVKDLNGYWSKKPVIAPGTTFRYKIPDFVRFQTPVLQKALEIVGNSDLVISENGQVLEPESFVKHLKDIKVGYSSYKISIGGLHSNESCAAHVADENTLLIDRDVASYYPSIILNQDLFPKHMGKAFTEVYRSIVHRRLAAKKAKDKVTADSLKITINGGFGKFGSKYSELYSPDLLMQVTISGQLCLLMLIEMLELNEIPVVSGNTDGIIMKCHKSKYEQLNKIISQWERITGFETEETRYKAIYSRDVNNFFIVKEKGDVEARFLDEIEGLKVKGCYCERGSALNSILSKNPQTLICSDAIIKLLSKGIPIEETIKSCTDIRRFVSVIKVTGGGEKDGVYLGKTVRHYYAKGVQGCINRVVNGNKVPDTDNAKALMDLPLTFPKDVDYDKYVKETVEMLTEIGYIKKEKQLKFF